MIIVIVIVTGSAIIAAILTWAFTKTSSEIKTDTTKYKQVAEIQIWINDQGNYDLWIDNTLWHNRTNYQVSHIINRIALQRDV
ncbi:hypothetical protein ACFLXT_02665 [Chloroflexota bacterium]